MQNEPKRVKSLQQTFTNITNHYKMKTFWLVSIWKKKWREKGKGVAFSTSILIDNYDDVFLLDSNDWKSRL